MSERYTRRALVGMLPSGWLAAQTHRATKAGSLPPQVGEFVRFLDPTTENPVVRLTSPAYRNILPARENRFISARRRTLLFSSDRYGRLSPCEADLRTGVIRLLAECETLDGRSVTADASGRFLYFLDGKDLREGELGGRREKKRAETVLGDVTAFGMGISRSDLFAIRGGRLEKITGRKSELLAEQAMGPCLVRPGGAGCLFGRAMGEGETALWYAAMESPGKAKLVAQGRIFDPCWSADGRWVLFLREVPKNGIFLSEIYQAQADGGGEHCVAKTSQFAAFSPNQDATVFAGASRSKAQPNIVLLVRSASRELTLCEHRSSRPEDVQPVFSPDSRRVYFQSDREGKPAIYSVNVETLVEPTGQSG